MVNGFDGRAPPALLDPELGHLVRAARRARSAARTGCSTRPRSSSSAARASTCTTADGNAYLDAYNNVPSVGHSHPRVTEAVSRGSSRRSTRTPGTSPTASSDYAERLLATHAARPGARDVHLHRQRGQRPRAADRPAPHRRHRGDRDRQRLPRRDVGRRRGLPQPRPTFRSAAHVRAVPAPPDAAAVAAAIADLERHGVRLAAFLADSLLSSDGVLPDPAGFLKPVQDAGARGGRAVHRRRGAVRLRPHRLATCGATSGTASTRTS